MTAAPAPCRLPDRGRSAAEIGAGSIRRSASRGRIAELPMWRYADCACRVVCRWVRRLQNGCIAAVMARHCQVDRGQMDLSETPEHVAVSWRDFSQCGEIYHSRALCHCCGHGSTWAQRIGARLPGETRCGKVASTRPPALIPSTFHPAQAPACSPTIGRHDMCHSTLS
jgi:hypothetical protein